MADNVVLNDLDYGNVNISNDVIEIITSIAASEIDGISGLSGNFTQDFVELFGKKNLKKGIHAVIDEENRIVVDINVIVNYGIKIPDIAWEVQENVKKAIETMTGLEVMEINVHISGINMKSDK